MSAKIAEPRSAQEVRESAIALLSSVFSAVGLFELIQLGCYERPR